MTTTYYYNYIRTTYLEKYKKTGENGCILSTFLWEHFHKLLAGN